MNESQAELVLDWYGDLEQRVDQLLGTVPFTSETEDTFLPCISSIVLEAASLLDTVFRTEYTGTKPSRELTIQDFSQHYEGFRSMSTQRTVLFRHPLRYLCPFDGWLDSNGKYSSIAWWNAYNKLKHDRIQHFNLSTLNNALLAVCALHQAIALLPCFAIPLFRRDLIVYGSWNPKVVADVMQGRDNDLSVIGAFETSLFCTSVIPNHFPSDLRRIRYFMYGRSRLFRQLVHIDRTHKAAT